MKEVSFESKSNYSHNPRDIIYDVIIIGTGVAGYSAAMYSSRLGLNTLIIGERIGGTVVLTDVIENYPGFVSVKGHKLAEFMKNHAMDYNIDMLIDIVDKVEKKDELFLVNIGSKTFKSKTIILATGSESKKLGIEGEDKFLGRGISTCALCESNKVKDKVVVVIGGGDSAIKEANFLSKFVKKLYILNNEKTLHGEQSNLDKLKKRAKKSNLEIINNVELKEIKGNKKINNIEFLVNNKLKRIAVDWIFVYIGSKPNSSLVDKLNVDLNKNKEIIINERCETSIEGVYAAGDVTDKSWNQVIIAASQGVTAAYNIHNYLESKN